MIAQQNAGGIGLLFYTRTVRELYPSARFPAPHPRGKNNDNSGVFVRFRDRVFPIRRQILRTPLTMQHSSLYIPASRSK